MSKKNVTYKQCRLKNGNRTTTAWIPAKFATIGKTLEIKGEDGWVVISSGKTTLGQLAVKNLEKAHRNHRKGCDI